MADNLPNVPVPAGSWTDLYAATGITVGTKLRVENVGSCDVYLAVQATQPAKDHNAYNIVKRRSDPLVNNVGDRGAWAYCNNENGLLNVSREFVEGFCPPVQQEVSIVDENNQAAMVSMPGEQHVGFKIDDVSVNFQYGISSFDVRAGGAISGTGTITAVDSSALIGTGAGVGTVFLESVEAVRYRAGHEMFAALSVSFGEPQEGVDQYCGFINDVDAWAPGYNGLDFGIWFVANGALVKFIKQIDFSEDTLGADLDRNPSGFVINPQGRHVVKPMFVWHGVLDLILKVRSPRGQWITVHKEVFINTPGGPHLGNPNLPLGMKIERAEGAGDSVVMRSSSWRGGVVAGGQETNHSNRPFGEFKLGQNKSNNAIDHLLTLRSKATFQGKVNHIKAVITLIDAVNSTNKDLVFYALRLSSLNAADQAAIEAAFSDIDSDDAVMESSIATFELTSTIIRDHIVRGTTIVVQGNGQVSRSQVENIDILPEQDLVWVADDLGQNASGTVSLDVDFIERH